MAVRGSLKYLASDDWRMVDLVAACRMLGLKAISLLWL